jgi:hypothetical protein
VKNRYLTKWAAGARNSGLACWFDNVGVKTRVVRSWWQNIALAGLWLLLALLALCVFTVKADEYPVSAVFGALACLSLGLILAVRAIRIGAFAYQDHLKIRGQLVTRRIPWGSLEAVGTRVMKDRRSAYYLPVVEYRDAEGRSRVAIMYWSAAMRLRSAVRLEASMEALVPQDRGHWQRQLRSDDILKPG